MEILSSFLAVALLMGGQVGLPLGLPPLPEDPVLSRIAPEECLAYFSSAGVGEPDPKSKNQTEQLLAEPEVRQFVDAVGSALGTAIKKDGLATPQGRVLGENGPKLIHTLLTHPLVLFVATVAFDENGPEISGGLIVGTGDQTDETKTALEEIEKVLLGTKTPAAANAKWHKLPAMPNAPIVEWGFRGKYLIVGIGTGSADEIAERMAGQPPKWLVALKAKLPVERVSTVFYLNVKQVIELATPSIAAGDTATAKKYLEALGLANVQSMAVVAGLDGTGCISKTWVQTAGEPSGALAIFGPEPLTAADLAPIPKDVSLAFAGRVSVSRIVGEFFKRLSKINAEAAEGIGVTNREFAASMGFRLQEDLLDTLGDTWCVYNSPGEGGLLITGLTIVVPVKDHDRLVKTNELLIKAARAAETSAREPIKRTTFLGQTIFSTNTGGFSGDVNFLPLAQPAWCITDNHLILSLSAQNIRAFLSRGPTAGSLADLPRVGEQIKSGHSVLLSYQDTASMMKITYPILQIIAAWSLPELQREGLDFDISMLPSLASLLRHVEPDMGTLSLEKDGIVYVSRQSLPGGGAFPGLMIVGGITLFSSIEMQGFGTQDIQVRTEPRGKPQAAVNPASLMGSP